MVVNLSLLNLDFGSSKIKIFNFIGVSVGEEVKLD